MLFKISVILISLFVVFVLLSSIYAHIEYDRWKRSQKFDK